jgi:hypothetical protein
MAVVPGHEGRAPDRRLGGAQPQVAAFWPLLLGAVAIPYAVLVIAPRAVADPGASGVAWTVRFLIFLRVVPLAAIPGIR